MPSAGERHNVPMSDNRAPAPRLAHWIRAAGNLTNLSTLVGLGIAALGRSRLRMGPELLILAEEYRLGIPKAGAFTVGGVVLVPGTDLRTLETRRPGTTTHEARHSWQYFWCLGLPFFPLYAAAAGWSWLRRGEPASGNWFERDAGLDTGGYPDSPITNVGWRRLIGAVGRIRRAKRT